MFALLLLDARLILNWLTHAAWQAGLLAMVVLALTWILGSRLQPRWRFAALADRVRPPRVAGSARNIVEPVSHHSDSRWVSASRGRRFILHALADQTADGRTNSRLDESRNAGSVARKNPHSVQEPPAAPASVTWLPTQLFVLIWIAGVAILSLRRIVAFVQLHRLKRRWQRITDLNVLSVLGKCSEELRFSRNVSLYMTPDNLGPATCGVVPRTSSSPKRFSTAYRRQNCGLCCCTNSFTFIVVMCYWTN